MGCTTRPRLLCPRDSPGKNGLPFPSRGDLLDPGIRPVSPALQPDSLLLSHQGSLCNIFVRGDEDGYSQLHDVLLDSNPAHCKPEPTLCSSVVLAFSSDPQMHQDSSRSRTAAHSMSASWNVLPTRLCDGGLLLSFQTSADAHPFP